MKTRTTITNTDRMLIESMWRDGATAREIAERIGTDLSSIYRELKRGFDNTAISPGRCGYSAEVAIQAAEEAMTRKHTAQCQPRRRKGPQKPRKAEGRQDGERELKRAGTAGGGC